MQNAFPQGYRGLVKNDIESKRLLLIAAVSAVAKPQPKAPRGPEKGRFKF